MSKKVSSNGSKLFLACSSKKHSQAAEIIESNVDLLSQILLRVPVKSLIKFKSVSKRWLSFISDPQFASNHTRRNPSSLISGLYFCTKHDSSLPLNDQVMRVSVGSHHQTSLPSFSFLDGGRSGATTISVCHSSNGLMLCRNGDGYYIVCNLTTQKFIALPKPSSGTLDKSYHEHGSYLIFDPTKSPYYKVVSVNCSYDLNTCHSDIYSSEGASWKTMCSTPYIRHSARGAVWNGAIIWMSCEHDGMNYERHELVYFQLDVDAEKLTTTRVPRDAHLSKRTIKYFGECGGHLLLLVPCCDTEFRVLEMDTDNYSWIDKYRVDLTPLILPYRNSCRFFVMSVLKGAKENDLAVVLYNRGKVISYNLECKTLKVLCDVSRGDIASDIDKYSYQFIESLSPV